MLHLKLQTDEPKGSSDYRMSCGGGDRASVRAGVLCSEREIDEQTRELGQVVPPMVNRAARASRIRRTIAHAHAIALCGGMSSSVSPLRLNMSGRPPVARLQLYR